MPFGLTAVAGLEVGHFTDPRRPTGCTVVIARAGAVAGVDVRGASPGTRETELLDPVNAIDKVHAIVLAGGSAFGLDAASHYFKRLTVIEMTFGDTLFQLGEVSRRMQTTAGVFA